MGFTGATFSPTRTTDQDPPDELGDGTSGSRSRRRCMVASSIGEIEEFPCEVQKLGSQNVVIEVEDEGGL